jgi:hypothetical protein
MRVVMRGLDPRIHQEILNPCGTMDLDFAVAPSGRIAILAPRIEP